MKKTMIYATVFSLIAASVSSLPVGAAANSYQITGGTQAALPAGTNNIGKVVIASGSAAIGTVGITTSATGGSLPFFNAAISTTSTQVKATAGQLYSLSLLNTGAAMAYLQIYSVPVATVGTTVPVYVIPVASGSPVFVGFPGGLLVGGTGVSLAGTTTTTGAEPAPIAVSASYQ